MLAVWKKAEHMYIGTLEGRDLVQYIMSYLSTIYLIPDLIIYIIMILLKSLDISPDLGMNAVLNKLHR